MTFPIPHLLPLDPILTTSPPPFPSDPPFLRKCVDFTAKWTPRATVSFISGYYSLGIAYEKGYMAKIDQIVIRVMYPSIGYMGIATFMPKFQWYSAWGIRISAALLAGVIYDTLERICLIFWNYIQSKINLKKSLPIIEAPEVD